jgi:DsbC/DsbD-like thiol-disulfide interchange protein
MKPMRCLAGLVCLLGLTCIASGQAVNRVQVQMLADTTAVVPGRPFTVGLLFHVIPNWHVYWTNPGDAGSATLVKWTVPPGFSVKAAEYPVPEIIPEPDNLVVYAYEHELLLTATVTPPRQLAAAASVSLAAAANWCVCSTQQCVLGKKAVELTLPVVQPGQSRPANAPLFAAWRARLPLAADHAFASINVQAASSSGPSGQVIASPSFTWRGGPPAGKFAWLPGPCDDLNVKATAIQTQGKTTQITLQIQPVQGIPADSATISGLLAYYVPGRPAAGVAVTLNRRTLRLPMPAGPLSSVAGAPGTP